MCRILILIKQVALSLIFGFMYSKINIFQEETKSFLADDMAADNWLAKDYALVYLISYH